MEDQSAKLDHHFNQRQAYVWWFVIMSLAVLIVGSSIFLFNHMGNPLAGVLYEWPGNPRPTAVSQAQGQVSSPMGDPHRMVGGIDVLAERLKRKLERDPDNAEGWALLGRSYVELDRHQEAIPAFEKALALLHDDPQLIVDYVDTLGVVNGGHLDEQAAQLIQKARKLDPRNVKARLLAATIAFDRKHYREAINLWEEILQDDEIESSLAYEINDNIQEARSLQNGRKSLASDVEKPSLPFDPSLRGTIDLDPSLQKNFRKGDTLYIFARAENGSVMPVAVDRVINVDFPYAFYLDDAHSVMPGRKLSEAGAVTVVARLSKSGDAKAAVGDLEGKSVRVKPGDRDVRIVIDTELP